MRLNINRWSNNGFTVDDTIGPNSYILYHIKK